MLEQCHRKIEEMNEKLKRLEIENRLLLAQKSHEEMERLQKKKQSLTLTLKNTTCTNDVQTDTTGLTEGAKTTGTETCDTFHTANSDCSFASALPSPFPPKTEAHRTPASEVSSLPDDGKALMSDSGVCLETKIHEPPTTSVVHPIAKHCFDGDNLSTSSSHNFYEQLLHSQMGKLREEIAGKKAKIMKLLEMGGEKSALDMMINELQDLQKDIVKMEMRLENSRGKNSNSAKIVASIMMMKISLFAQMVAFQKAKCQLSYVKSPAVLLIAMSRVIIRSPCQRCQRATTASRRAYLLITSWQGRCPLSRDRFNRRRRYVSTVNWRDRERLMNNVFLRARTFN